MRAIAIIVLGYVVWLFALVFIGVTAKVTVGLSLAWLLNGGSFEGNFDPSKTSTIIGLVCSCAILELIGLPTMVEELAFAKRPSGR